MSIFDTLSRWSPMRIPERIKADRAAQAVACICLRAMGHPRQGSELLEDAFDSYGHDAFSNAFSRPYWKALSAFTSQGDGLMIGSMEGHAGKSDPRFVLPTDAIALAPTPSWARKLASLTPESAWRTTLPFSKGCPIGHRPLYGAKAELGVDDFHVSALTRLCANHARFNIDHFTSVLDLLSRHAPFQSSFERLLCLRLLRDAGTEKSTALRCHLDAVAIAQCATEPTPPTSRRESRL